MIELLLLLLLLLLVSFRRCVPILKSGNRKQHFGLGLDGHYDAERVIGCDTCSVSYVGFVRLHT